MKARLTLIEDQGNSDLPAESWYPDNLRVIETVINKLTQSCLTKDPVAVFDFDNTCIFRDIGQAVFRYQCSYFRFRLSPEQFAGFLPQKNIALHGRPLQEITARLGNLYSYLWQTLSEQPAPPSSLVELKQFSILLQWFVQQARKDEQLGAPCVLLFLCNLLAGFSVTELKCLADEVIDQVSKETLVSEQETIILDDPVGIISVSYEKGLKPFPEIQTLMRWLTGRGVRCLVISASTSWLVEQAVKRFDFPVDMHDVYGIRCQLTPEDILTPNLPENYPVTYRQGKADIINRFINKTPLLVAGDADTDYEMLTLPDVPLKLIVNRNQRGLIRSLYERSDYLLQGVDRKTGRFRPFRETV